MERLYLESGQKIKKISVNEKEEKLFIAVSKDLNNVLVNKAGQDLNLVQKSRIEIVVCDLNFEKRTISKIACKKFKTIRNSQNEGPLEIEMHSSDSESG